jgi:hypothetical protein
VPAAFGDGLEGPGGAAPPPFPAGVGLGAWWWAATAERVAPMRTAAVGPNVETVDETVTGVSSSARSPAATLPKLAAVEDVSGALVVDP